MGGLWLPDLDDWLRDAGLDVRTWDGWLTNSRGSGGFDDIYGLVAHHDVSAVGGATDTSCRYAWEVHQYRPVGNTFLGRDGEWVIGAAGAANTQGKGGPFRCSRGTVPLDQGNRYMFATEGCNNGQGEPWGVEQQRAYARGFAAIIVGLRTKGAYNAATGQYKQIVLDPLQDVIAHFEWAPTRKIDPAGPSQWADTADRYQRWKMDEFRASVAAEVADLTGSTPPPSGGLVEHTSDRWTSLSESERMYDSRPGEPAHHNPTVAKTKLAPGETRKIAVAMAHATEVRISTVNAAGEGWLAVSGTPDGEFQSPVCNYTPDGVRTGNVRLATPDGHIYLRSSHHRVDVIVNTWGYAAD
jgi:hypothetical protein